MRLRASRVTPATSLTGSNGSLGWIAAPVVYEVEETYRVWPSAGDLTIKSAAIIWLAPGRLSTITGCLNASLRRWLIARAKMSLLPPAGAPTRMRKVLDGKAGCAAVCAAPSARKLPHKKRERRDAHARIGSRGTKVMTVSSRFGRMTPETAHCPVAAC